MKSRLFGRRRVAALLLGLPAAATRLRGNAAPAAATAAAVAVPPLGFHERTLPNGLKVYTARDTSTPNVTVQVWYRVGSKDDPAGRSGFAHLFEHLMFKATQEHPGRDLRPADRGRGRLQQRLHLRRLHRLLRGRPGQPPGAAAVRRGRPDGRRWWSTRTSSSPSATW